METGKGGGADDNFMFEGGLPKFPLRPAEQARANGDVPIRPKCTNA